MISPSILLCDLYSFFTVKFYARRLNRRSGNYIGIKFPFPKALVHKSDKPTGFPFPLPGFQAVASTEGITL